MAWIKTRDLSLGFGGELVLDGVGFAFESGERVCVVGRNGEGKSSLLKLLVGELRPDGGQVILSPGARIGFVQQEIPAALGGTVIEVVLGGLQAQVERLREYHTLSAKVAGGEHGAADMARMDALYHRIEQENGWDPEAQVKAVLSQWDLEGQKQFSNLSGGLKRRALMARALVSEPAILLLDEPTNHLDIPSIDRMEKFCINFPGILVFITHDRMFAHRVATRILELDRGKITDWPGDYDRYKKLREAELKSEMERDAVFDKKLKDEEVWIRQGIKARRTRNMGRVRALEALRLERKRRRDRVGAVKMQLEEATRSGKLVIEAENLSFQYDGVYYIRHFSTLLQRGDKVGIIGANGSGKSTLLSLFLGSLAVQEGSIRLGTRLEIAYFDQLRESLEEEKSVADNVANGREQVMVGGQSRHIIGYLGDFLFPPQRARTPVKALSGGERNRLLLARLFLKPSNLLVMDEPTNDLDVETLELLEELLANYDGTMILVSHDRAFLNNVVTSTLVFEEGGHIGEYVGGYDDWLAQRPQPQIPVSDREEKKTKSKTVKPQIKKRSFAEKKELAELPHRIESLELELQEIQTKMSNPNFYKESQGEEVANSTGRMRQLEETLGQCYQRWEILEAMPD